ncbi:protein of unknown function [Candidatus Filomicrobium marinum]|nr:protein of unknown function [Candidatus Filomicrobium marinum]
MPSLRALLLALISEKQRFDPRANELGES